MRVFAIIVLMASVCACDYFVGDSKTPPPAAAGDYGFFTYTAIDGSQVTVARQSPDPEWSNQLVGAGVAEGVK